MKRILNDGRTVVDKYRQTLRNLRVDFLSETIMNVEGNVIRILAEVETINESIKELGVSGLIISILSTKICPCRS